MPELVFKIHKSYTGKLRILQRIRNESRNWVRSISFRTKCCINELRFYPFAGVSQIYSQFNSDMHRKCRLLLTMAYVTSQEVGKRLLGQHLYLFAVAGLWGPLTLASVVMGSLVPLGTAWPNDDEVLQPVHVSWQESSIYIFSQLCSVTSCWGLAIHHSRSIYTTEISKHVNLFLFFPPHRALV